ncbi:MAG: guanylate kinase [Haliscomenobacter sp.]
MQKLLLFAAPSGSGKTTIVRRLLGVFPTLAFSVSATTRSPRANEQHGRDYYFLDKEAFLQKIESGDFVEWEEVYPGVFYGTLRQEVERLWHEKKDVIFDVDVQGALRIKAAYPAQSLAIFVKPPSMEVLAARLKSRQTESTESLETRLGKAAEELLFQNKFDYVLVNDELDIAVEEAKQLVHDWLYPG